MSRPIELYTGPGCEYCAAAREDFEWRGIDYVEYDVSLDASAFQRLLALTGGAQTVPVIVEEGRPVQIGWMGRGCAVFIRPPSA